MTHVHIMLDLETMGTSPNAAIVAIGAVAFDPLHERVGDRFACQVDLASAVDTGGVIDASTVYWWLQQSDAARAALRGALVVPLRDALHQFAEWLQRQLATAAHPCVEELRVWGNGADFDCVILACSYRRCGMSVPWGPFGARCYRTLKSLVPEIKLVRVGTHHNALIDAVQQADAVIKSQKLLESWKFPAASSAKGRSPAVMSTMTAGEIEKEMAI